MGYQERRTCGEEDINRAIKPVAVRSKPKNGVYHFVYDIRESRKEKLDGV